MFSTEINCSANNMRCKYGVIDIGSNSVRLMLSDGERTLNKENEVTALAQGQGEDSMLKKEAIERTALAVFNFYRSARRFGAEEIYAFATASARKAKNKKQLTDRIEELTGLRVQIIGGEEEAFLGATGALGGEKNGAVIDVGGASTELTVRINNEIVYSKSVDIGAVFLTELFGQDRSRVKEFVDKKLTAFNDAPKILGCVFGIGGTATSVAAILQRLEPYDATKTHGFVFETERLERLVCELYDMSVEDRAKLKGLQKKRAEIIANGAEILLSVLKKIQSDSMKVSESDNLEGYLIEKLKGDKPSGDINEQKMEYNQ